MTRSPLCHSCRHFSDRIATLARRACHSFVVGAILLGAQSMVASTTTTTTLAVTPASPVNAGAVATLTASVKESGGATVTSGTILFYDSFSPNLPIGTAQLTSAGLATMRKVFGVGSHGLTAKFVPTKADLTSTSTVQTLAVTGTGSYASSVSLGDNTSNGNTLTVSAKLSGVPPPIGNVTIQSSVTNSTLGSVALTPTSFAQDLPKPYPTSTTIVALITADFNGDGLPDLAGVTGTGKVSVLLGKEDGTFQPAVEYGVGAGAIGIVAGDFNHDGKVDIAVTNQTDNTVSILIGVGDGTFLTQTTFATGSSPVGIATMDMDGDGKLDLIVVDNGSFDGNGDSQLEIFSGKGDGTFVTPSTKIIEPSYGGQYVAVGDLNGDGLPDIVVSFQPSVITVSIQKADGTYQAPVTYFGDSGLRGVSIADFNNDGKADILVNAQSLSDYSGEVDIFLGNGDGTLKDYKSYPSASGSVNAVIGDFNHDGILDYAVGSNSSQIFFGSSVVSLHFGVGDGTFGNNIGQTTSAGSVEFPLALAAADFTGDGLLGIAAGGEDSNIFVNLGYQNAAGTLPNITVIQEDSVTGTYIPGTGDAYAGSTSQPLTLEPPSYFYSLIFDGNPTVLNYTTGDTPAPLSVIVEQNEVRSTTAAFPVTLTVKTPNGANASYMQTTVNGATSFSLPVFTTAGTYAVTASSPSVGGGNATVSIVVAAGPQTPTSLFISAPYTAHASQGIAAPVTLAVLDQFGNPDLTFTGTVALTTTDSAAQLTPASHTFVAADGGVFTFQVVFHTLGTQSLTFSSAGLAAVTQAGIHVLPPSVTTLSFSSTPVDSLSPVSLQATVTVGGQPATRGTVNFYDSFSTPSLIATAQLNAKGEASITMVLGAGSHPIIAKFTGNLNAGASTSASQTLLVTPKQNYVSTDLIQSGGNSIYQVADGAGFFGRPRPTGHINFIDSNHGNAILDTETLGSPYYSFTVNTDDTPVGIAPYAIVAGDFNGDGRPDVLTVNSNSTDNTISLLLGNGDLDGQINPDGTVNDVAIFQAPLIYAVGNRPAGIVTGDFNADGKLDVAVANTGDGTVSVLLGKGDGTFQTPITLTVGNAPVGIATGDIDGDGNLDLVVANSGDGTVSILRGNGDGTFQTQTTVPVGTSPQNIAVADLNGDGALDMAVTNGASNTVSILLGNGDGTFKAGSSLGTGASPFAIVALDVAGTGKVSLAATNFNDGTVSFFKANGNGTFQTATTLTACAQPTGMTVADFYNSGFLNLAVSCSGAQVDTVTIFNTDGNGGFLAGGGATQAAAGPNPQGIVAADVAGVGLASLVIAGKNASNQYDGLVSRPAISVLPVLQTYAAIAGLGIGIVDTDEHVVIAAYVPGPADAYEASSSGTGLSIPGTQLISAQLTAVPSGPFTAGVAFPNIREEADQAGQVDTAYTGPLTLRIVGLDVSYSKTYTATAVAGKASIPATPLTLAGTYRFYISLNGTNEIYIINSDVLVVAASASQAVITTPFISPAARGVSGAVGVTVEDSFGNTVTNYTGTVGVTTTDPASSIKPASHTFITNDAGFASFAVTFNTTGTQSITASATGLTPATQNGIVVIAPQLSTTTALAFTPASPQPAETAVTLTATVKDSANTPITLGVVNFYDTAASPHLIAAAPLTGTGTASIKINFAVGTHGISATFQPKNADQGSSSGTQTLVISAAANYITQTALSNTGTPSGYSLLANVGAFGAALPTGKVSFLDTSNGNASLGTVSLGAGTSAFGAQVPYTVGFYPGDVIQADFNGDGKLDLVVLNTGSASVSFLPGNGDGTFGTVKTTALTNSSGSHMASGDFNGDGMLDLAIVNADGTLSLLLGNGDGTFQSAITVTGLFTAGESSQFGALAGIAVGDFNRDGKLDIAVSNVVDGTVLVLLGYGDGSFQQPVFYAGETGPQGLAVADMNGDGYPDIVVANSNGDTVSVLLGNGDGTFGNQATYAVDEVPTQVAIADFNGDGKPDVAVTNEASGTVSILLGKGDGTLLAAVTSATGNGPTNLITGDFDGDGKQDVVVINQSDNTAALLLGKGDGTLGASAPFTTGDTPDGLAAGDFTGSGRLSIAVSSRTGEAVSVLLGEEVYPAPLTPVSFVGTGLHKVEAVYNTGAGDAYASSTSATVNLYGAAAPIPTVTITSSKNPADVGNAVTLTASVQSSTEGLISGSVSFYEGKTLLGMGTISGGGASISISTLPLGAHSITAVYSGNSTYANATSPVFQQVIGAIATSTTVLVSSSNPAIVGQSVTFTATVTSTTAGTPTGTVQFFSDGTSIGTGTLNGSATTSVATSALVFGPHSIKAVYSGDPNYQTSTAFAITQSITKTPTSTLLGVQFTQIENYGPDNYTATVAPASGTGTPTGQVDFSDGTQDLGKVTLNGSGVAVLNGFPDTLGAHNIVATYLGDTTYAGSASPTIVVTVSPPPQTTVTTATATPNPTDIALGTTFNITVTGGDGGVPTGSVGLVAGGGFSAGSATLDSHGKATITLATPSAGSFGYYVAYYGDVTYQPSNSNNVRLDVAPDASTPVLILTLSKNPVLSGQPEVFTVTVKSVSGAAPTGTVTLADEVGFDPSATIATITLNNGVGTFTSTSLAVSDFHELTATYNGDSTYKSGASDFAFLEVDQGPTQPSVTTLTVSPNPVTVGGAVQLTATVTANSSLTPSGTVTFYDGSRILYTQTLNPAGVATFSISSLPAGSHPITAAYNGDSFYNTSVATATALTVGNGTLTATTTAVTSSLNPSTFGASVTFSATVAPATGTVTPTGSVMFMDGATLLGTGTLAGGHTSVTTTALSTASHNITAVYSGDGSFSTSTSALLVQVVGKAASSATSLTTSSANVVEGVSVTFTAHVSSTVAGTLTGSVNFMDGSNEIGTGTVAAGVATFATSTLGAGTHTITAVYGGDVNFPVSTSAAVTETVAQGTTTTAVTTSAGSVAAGQSVTFTATVATTAAGTPTGTVSFYDGATLLGSSTLNGLVATYSTSSLSAGTHSITATYSGDTTFATSTSTALSQTITAVATSSVTTVASSLNPAAQGTSVTFTATVAVTGATAPTGNITFYDGATVLSSTALLSNKTATFTTSALSVGSHNITAVYAGDTNFTGSTSAILAQVVTGVAIPTTVTVISSLNPATAGQGITFTATLSATGQTAPSGNVSFFDGATLLGSTAIAANKTATFTTSTLKAGAHTITVTYAGDANYATSTSAALTETVNAIATTISVASSLNPSAAGQSVTFTATLTALGDAAPSGNVNFYDGATLLGSTAITGTRSATFTTAALTAGSHTITATYVGDGNYATSTSVALTQVVNTITTTATVASSLNPSPVGTSVTFTATIAATGTIAPTGNVNFYDGATLLGSTAITASKTAAFSTSTLSVGSHSITAVYAGDTNYVTSTSTVVTQVVNTVTTTISVVSSLNPSVVAQSVTFTATVTATGTTAPTGNVTFFDGATSLGSTAITASKTAAFSTSTLASGSHSITAVYAGDTNYVASTSAVVTQVVNKAVTTATLTSSVNPSTPGQSVTFTATLASTTTGTETGTVVFSDGATVLSTVTLTSNVATYTTSALSTSSHTITATYSGDGTFAGVTSPSVTQVVSLVLADFTLSIGSPNQTINPGGSATYNISAASVNGAFNNVVTMSVTGLPAGATATFAPPTITPGAASATSVLTVHVAPLAARVETSQKMWFAALLLLLPAMRRKSRSLPRIAAVVVWTMISLGAVMGITGCGGGFFGQAPQTYTLTITGTSGATTHSTTTTLQVQ